MTDKVRDLRSALKRLESMPGQLITTDVEVDLWQSWQVYTVMWVQEEPLCGPQRKDLQ